MSKTRCDAWFCRKCHAYHEKKIFSANLPSGKIYNSHETCNECGNSQQVEVKTDYWGAEPSTKEAKG